MRTPLLATFLLLVLAGCGGKPAPAAADENSTAIAIAPDEPAQPGEGGGAAAGITAIDAATGDAKAMPADSAAPSAYDLAQRAERSRDAEARREQAAEAPRPSAPTDLLPGGDEAVTAGD